MSLKIYNVVLGLGLLLLSGSFSFGQSSNSAASEIQLSHKSGFYEEPFELSISSTVPGTIFYTLDGSDPESSGSCIEIQGSSTLVIDPEDTENRSKTPGVVLRASFSPTTGGTISNPISRTFIFLDALKTQIYPQGDWPSGSVNSQVFDYNMDPSVVNHVLYKDLIEEAFTDIPSISIITDNDNLFGRTNGIYVNALQDGIEWERECSVELINADGSEGFDVNAGLRIRGGWSRNPWFPKHSFRLFFREAYGNAKLEFPLFEDEGVSKFDKIDLRCSQNYSWAREGEAEFNTFVREVFTRDTQRDSGHPYTRSRYYHLYLNGLYWGMYQTQERAEARFAASYLGGDKEDYDVIKVDRGSDFRTVVIATDGTDDKWKEVFDFTNNGFDSNQDYFRLEGKDEDGLPANNGEVYVDIDNLIDYMMNIFYSGNFDSPVSAYFSNSEPNNMYAIVNRENKSKGFQFFIHDAEHALMSEATPGPGIGLQENRVNLAVRGFDRMREPEFRHFNPQWLHHRLTANDEYKIRFADHAYHQLREDGIFTKEKCIERFNTRAEQIEMAIIAESARWGDGNGERTYTRDVHWRNQINDVTRRYFPQRGDIVISQLRQLSLFPRLDAPQVIMEDESRQEDEIEIASAVSISLTSEKETATVYYTLDGSDPRAVGGEIGDKAIAYENGTTIGIEGSAILNARSKQQGIWGAIRTTKFLQEQTSFSDLKITELHYNPMEMVLDGDTVEGKNFEFIEFRNTGDEGLNLSGLLIDTGITYEFPDNTILLPDEYYVIASKPKWFYERYRRTASGNFAGNLSNSGEQIVIKMADGSPVFDFSYEDENPWPQAADGDGYSLSSIDLKPNGVPGQSDYWTASANVHGTPFGIGASIVASVEESNRDFSKAFSVFPNPTDGVFNISSKQAGSYQISLRSLNGSLLLQKEVTGNEEVSIASLGLPGGVYLVEFNSGHEVYRQKLVYRVK